MDHAPYTGDLNLDAVGTQEQLAHVLRVIRLRADEPSLRTLAVRTRLGLTPLSKTAIADMLRGVRLPREAVMIAFLEACGVPDTEMKTWRRIWKRVADAKGAVIRTEAARAALHRQRQANVTGKHPSWGPAEMTSCCVRKGLMQPWVGRARSLGMSLSPTVVKIPIGSTNCSGRFKPPGFLCGGIRPICGRARTGAL